MSSPGLSNNVVTIRPLRSIGGIYPNITISEMGEDELTITDHPVEQGAAITDHAFKNPSALKLEVAWSNSSDEAGDDAGYCEAIYQKMLDLQAKREPFDVITGQRKYTNQLIRSISKATDEKTENALFLTVICREVILVNTQTTTVPPKAVQKQPKKTAPVKKAGNKQPAPAKTYNPPKQVLGDPIPGVGIL